MKQIEQAKKLIKVFCVFRHGHRNPMIDSPNPNDGNYEPGLLNLTGAKHSYLLGNEIGQKYLQLLTEIKIKDHLTIYSTNFSRTIETAFFVVKGLLNQPFVFDTPILDKLQFLYEFKFKRKLKNEDIIFGNSCYGQRCPGSVQIFNDNKAMHYAKKSHLQLSGKIQAALYDIFPDFKNSPDYHKLYKFYDYIHMCNLSKIKMPQNCSENFDKELAQFSYFYLYDLFYSNPLAQKLQNHFFNKIVQEFMIESKSSELILCSLHEDKLFSFALQFGFNINTCPEPCALFTIEKYIDTSSNKQYFRFLFNGQPFLNENPIVTQDNTYFDFDYLDKKIQLGKFETDDEFAKAYGKEVNVASWNEFIKGKELTEDLEKKKVKPININV